MRSTGKKIIIFIAIMIVLILLVNVFVRYISPFGPYRMASGSMEPAYNKGDLILFSKANDYKIGDAIIYKVSSIPGATRIIEINPDGTFKGKGDRNVATITTPMFDETGIEKEEILGRITFAIRWYVYYPLVYAIQIIIALLLTQLIYRKIQDRNH